MPLSKDDLTKIGSLIRSEVGRALLIDDRAGVNLRASMQQTLGEMFMRARRVDSTVARLTAEQAALADAVSQLGAGGTIDYSRVEAAARRASEDALRDVLGGLDG